MSLPVNDIPEKSRVLKIPRTAVVVKKTFNDVLTFSGMNASNTIEKVLRELLWLVLALCARTTSNFFH